MVEYILVEKSKSEFQKQLNQWKHNFEFEIIWIESFDKFADNCTFISTVWIRALIKRGDYIGQ